MKNVRLSVVVPVAKGGILLCLESLKKQKEKIEIIIESGSNPSSNRNKGIMKAGGEFVAFIRKMRK